MLISKILNLISEPCNIPEFKINRYIIINIILLVLLVSFFQLVDLDIIIQNYFYNPQKGWLIDRSDFVLKMIFYIVPKKIIICFIIIIVLLAFYVNLFLQKSSVIQKRTLLFLSASILSSLVLVALLKQITNMHCPDSIAMFGAQKPYVKLLEKFPVDFALEKQGKCFPAAHASVGFCLFAFLFVTKKKKSKLKLFVATSIIGWCFGFYQIAKGSHYISDTIVTMLLSFLVSLICYKFFICTILEKKK